MNTQPRVIVHTPEPRHGAAKYVCELVKALRIEGESVILLCPSNFTYKDDVLRAGGSIVEGSDRVVSRTGVMDRVGRNVRFLFLMLRQQYRCTRPGDILHVQFPLHLPLGFVFLLLAVIRRNKIVLTAHDPLPHNWRFVRVLRGFEREMKKWFYKLCNHIIVHNQTGAEVLMREFNIPRARISVIPHGPFSQAQQMNPLPAFDSLRLLVFGAIRKNKGTSLAIQAVQILNRDSVRVQLTISGCPQNEGERKYWDACKELIAQAPRGISVMERFTSEAELTSLIGRQHALLLPYLSFASESGVAALALSNRRPILATQAGGLGELLRDCPCGIPILQASSEGVVRAIANAIEAGAEKLREMGEEGERYLSRNRSWSAIARRTIEVYAMLKNGRNPGASTRNCKTAKPTVAHKRDSNGLPSFFVIGPARTGTSWLHKVLSEQTVLPAQKETYFFDDNFDKGLDWYLGCFGIAASAKAIGEIAPTYFASDDVRTRIAELIPTAKVICIFRNPVDRVSSLYRLRRAHARIPWTLDEAVDRDPELLETSRYATHLKAWQRTLGKENVMVTMYDDLRNRPQTYIDAIADFVNIPRFALRADQLARTYSSEGEKLTYPRSQKLMRLARATADWLVDHHLHMLVTTFKKTSLTSTILSSCHSFEGVTPETSLKLRNLLRPEIEELESMLNRDLSAWK